MIKVVTKFETYVSLPAQQVEEHGMIKALPDGAQGFPSSNFQISGYQ